MANLNNNNCNNNLQFSENNKNEIWVNKRTISPKSPCGYTLVAEWATLVKWYLLTYITFLIFGKI